MKEHLIRTYCNILFLLVVVGCSGITNSNSSIENESTLNQSAVENNMEEDSIIPMGTEQWPESGIYVTCGNYDFHLSSYGHNVFSFVLFSKEALPENAQIDVDTDRFYTFGIYEIDMVNDYSINEQTFKQTLYQCYKGMDWEQLYYLESQANEAKEKYEQEEEKEQKAILYEEYTMSLEEYWNMNDLYVKEYKQFLETAKEKVPTGYCYRINVLFPQNDEDGNDFQGSELITTVYLTIGEKKIPIEVGNIEISYDNIEKWDISDICHNIIVNTSLSVNKYISLYESPNCSTTNIIDGVIAEKDLVINNIYLYHDEDLEQRFRINIETEAGKQTVEWKKGRNILIRQGETFSIDVMYVEPKRSQGQYNGNKYIFVEYETEGQTCLLRGEEYIGLNYDCLWEAYAQYVEGIDVESYYQDYCNKRGEGFDVTGWYTSEE